MRCTGEATMTDGTTVRHGFATWQQAQQWALFFVRDPDRDVETAAVWGPDDEGRPQRMEFARGRGWRPR